MLFWRSFTHWVGGMGVLVFTMVVLPVSDGRAMHLMRAESPGPSVGKISSKIRDTAKILYAMYLVLTVVQTILLRLVGLPWYDALITAFGAAGTGGFSNRAASIGAYGSPAVEMITAVFMVLFGINFNVYFFLLIRHFKEAFACEEMRVYLWRDCSFHPGRCGQYLPLAWQCVAVPALFFLPGGFHHYHHGLCHNRF